MPRYIATIRIEAPDEIDADTQAEIAEAAASNDEDGGMRRWLGDKLNDVEDVLNAELPEGWYCKVSGTEEVLDYRYVLFTNEARTEMATCWRIGDSQWRVERARREATYHTWGPPDTKGMTGDLESITHHFKHHGLTEREVVK